MKKITRNLCLLSFVFLNISGALAQNTWTKMADFPGVGRTNVVSFTIGHYAFVGLGNNGSATYTDFYRWDQNTNTWASIPNYPGGGNVLPIAFSANGKGYVGMGEDAAQNKYKNLYSYDTISNTWTPRATFPGAGRYSAASFVVGHKAVVACGSFGGTYTSESWTYDANADSWAQNVNAFPGGNLEALCTFTIGNTGYVGCGWDNSSVRKAFWKYNMTNDTWTPIPNFPVAVGLTEVPNAFVVGSKGYVCTGLKDVLVPSNALPYGYAYDTLTQAWAQFTDMGAYHIKHAYSAEFAIGKYGYICSGQDSTGTAVSDFWQYGPKDTACDNWTQMADFPGVARENTVSFTIGHYAFVGLGNNGSTTYSDFYKWDQTTNVWTPIRNYPGGGNILPIAFSINGKGYVGLGEDGSQLKYTNLYEYDTLANTWTLKSAFPSTGRYSAAAFVVGQKAYMVCGSFGGVYTNESWVYDPGADHWSLNANPFPGGNLEALCAFTIGNQGYVGCGWDNSAVHKGFWKYMPSTDTWTMIQDFPVSVGLTEVPTGFVIGSKGYICTGLMDVLTPSNTLPYGYAFDTVTQAWSQFTDMAVRGIKHAYAAEFAIGNYGYICSGHDSTGTSVHDLWQYTPCTNGNTFVFEDQLQPDAALHVYPNPSQGIIFIDARSPLREVATLTVCNMLGEVVYSRDMKTGDQVISLDLSNLLSDGIYSVMFQNGQRVHVKKIILSR